MNKFNVGLIGCGCRGEALTTSILCNLNNVNVVCVCDPYLDKAENVAEKVKEKIGKKPIVFQNYNDAFSKADLDAVLVASAWEAHIEIAIAAMEKKIAVALEVGGAYSIEDCYKLVEVYERTKTPIMLMENCCFNKDELLATAMVRNGLLGNIVYCHGAYAHDLRNEIAYGNINRHYRLRNYLNRNCENYPTHELGPIAKVLNIGRGNRMVSLVSIASKSMGLQEYVEGREELKELKGLIFKQGDVVNTLITCENGETISLKLDTTLPRYYSREFTVRGTKGMYEQNNNMVLIDEKFEEIWEPSKFLKKYNDNAKEYEEKYLVDIWKNVSQEVIEAGHGGMDYFEFIEFFKALKDGTEMPIDVYDTVAWMCVSRLSEISISKGGAVVEIPDFTNGKYKIRPQKDVIELPIVR